MKKPTAKLKNIEELHNVLQWTALFVTQINSLKVKKGETIELIAADDDSAIIVTRSDKTHFGAFLRCVRHGMKQIALPKKLTFAVKFKA